MRCADIIALVLKLSRSRSSGLILSAFIAPSASRPILMYWVCRSFTLSRATLPISSHSALNFLPNGAIEPAAYLKVCPIVSLFFSRAVVNACVADVTSTMLARNAPVLLIDCIRLVCIDWISLDIALDAPLLEA